MQQRALAIVILGALVVGLASVWRWPATQKRSCPQGALTLDDAGVVGCGPGAELPAGQALTLGLKLKLNRVTADDLALLPGVGPVLANELIERRTRLGRFRSWDEVDAVPGVGPQRLAMLKSRCELGLDDAGL